MPNTNRIAGLTLVLIVLILAFIPLRNEAQAIASGESATAIEQTAGLLLPYILIFLIFVLGAAVVYEALKR